jgi:hypothetical protein
VRSRAVIAISKGSYTYIPSSMLWSSSYLQTVGEGEIERREILARASKVIRGVAGATR